MAKETIMELLKEAEEIERNKQTQTKRKPKLTFNDFIEMFNALKRSYRAYPNDRGGVKIVSNHDGDLKANLLPNSCVWALETSDFYPDELSLMAELAKTPPEERENVQKYVILNGLPRHGTCHYFLIDVYSCRLLPCQLDGLDESDVAAMGAYSKDGLREAKKALTPELAAAVDMMKVTLERAIELTENSRHADLD